MRKIKCSKCDVLHPVSDVEPSFHAPDDVFQAAKAGLAPHSGELTDLEIGYKLNADLCVMRESELHEYRYFVRSVLPIPMAGTTDVFSLGVWAEVSIIDFNYVIQKWGVKDQRDLPPLSATLANDLPATEGAKGLVLAMQLISADQRPTLTVMNPDHRLFIEQRDGITLERVNEYNGQYAVASPVY